MFAGERSRNLRDISPVLELNVERKSMAMKNRRLKGEHRWDGGTLTYDLPIVLHNPIRDGRQLSRGLLTVARHHVEGDLHVKNFLLKLLEYKQITRLLFQLAHPFL